MGGYARIVHQKHIVASEKVDAAWLKTLAEDPAHLALLQAVGFQSLMLAPLLARGKAAGLLLVGSTESARTYTPADLSLIELLATVTAATLATLDLERREAALNARLDNVTHAARELAHLVNNDLTLPVGAIEILIDRPDISPELREMIVAAASDLAAAEQHIRDFHQLVRGEPTAQPGVRPSHGRR